MTEPKRFPGRAEIASVRAEAELLDSDTEAASERRLAGRVLARRDLGKLTFLDLVDRSGRIQLLCSADRSGEVDVHLGDIVGAIGHPAKSRRGEPSLAVTTLELLAPIRTPLPDTFHGLTDVEQRQRRRYLDLMMNAETREEFVLRARLVSAVRRALDDDGFIEVETPILQPRYGGAFARPFSTHHNELDQTLYLRIATELYLKRLIVGGLERVYELGKDFRNEGVSFKHNPEFTMLEWYEAYADYRDTMDRMERLVARVAEETLGRTVVTFRGNEIDLATWRRVKLADALAEHGLWIRDEPTLRTALRERGIDESHDRTWAQLLDHALSHFVEPTLIQPTILHDYPVELSPFARAAEEEGMVERFEYYAGGMELGNAFTEINDSIEQAERFRLQAAEVVGGNVEAEPGDPDYVEALSYGMPPTGGLGMGIDRLAMLLLGKDSIRDVILFPALREQSR
jgi:lysyl-tRNA synthetase, class II